MQSTMRAAIGTALCLAGACIAENEVFEFTPSLIPIAASNNLFPMAKCHSFKLQEASIDEIQKALGDGRLTSVQLVQCYMTRMYQTDQYIKCVDIAPPWDSPQLTFQSVQFFKSIPTCLL